MTRPKLPKRQRLLWGEETISREKMLEGLTVMGLDPDYVRSVMMRPDCVEVEEFVCDDAGYKQMHPTIPDTVWTRVVVYEVN